MRIKSIDLQQADGRSLTNSSMRSAFLTVLIPCLASVASAQQLHEGHSMNPSHLFTWNCILSDDYLTVFFNLSADAGACGRVCNATLTCDASEPGSPPYICGGADAAIHKSFFFRFVLPYYQIVSFGSPKLINIPEIRSCIPLRCAMPVLRVSRTFIHQ
jgi:hypothetical protein